LWPDLCKYEEELKTIPNVTKTAVATKVRHIFRCADGARKRMLWFFVAIVRSETQEKVAEQFFEDGEASQYSRPTFSRFSTFKKWG